VLRTEELAAMHRFDGAEQYFTRAVDFGYTIDLNETIEQWGRDEIVGDYVRLIRTVRPDVISAQSPTATGPGQHAHHALAAILSHEAYKQAGDPTKYPEQIAAGLRPWQAKKFYFATGFGPAPAPTTGAACRVDLAGYDSLLGRTYAEIGTEARSMHKCQGQAQLLALPGPSTSTFQLAESTLPGQINKEETGLFDGVDTSIAGLAQLAGPRPPRELTSGLAAIASAVQGAQRRFDTESDAAATPLLLEGLRAVRILRGELRGMTAVSEEARFELEFRLRQKEREFQQAIVFANNIRVDALADDGLVVPGQPVRVSLIVANRGELAVSVKSVNFDGFAQDATCNLALVTATGGRGGRGGAPPPAATPISALRKEQVGRCDPTLQVKADERLTEPYWHREGTAGRYTFDADAPFGLPSRPTPFYVQVTFAFADGEEVIHGLPVQYRYEGNIFSGEKRADLLVVPSLSVRVSPEIAIVPRPQAASAPARQTLPAGGRGAAGRGAAGRSGGRGAAPAPPRAAPFPAREIRVTVVNDLKGPADTLVKLELPEGWTSTPAEQPVKFSREDESRTARFQVQPPAGTAPGEYQVKALASLGGQSFGRGYEVIEYPHIRRQHIYDAAAARLKVLDVRAAPDLEVGYVAGSGDEVAAFIEQLGARIDMLGPDAIAWGDLSKYDTIVLGVRAYERRDDLRANNARLIDYVQAGGTLIVQYNRATVGDAYGPYPAEISNNRVTDERAPVQALVPTHPVFTTPNLITETAWAGWVQERGLNFLGDKDSRYRDLVQLTDTFPNNPGAQRGALVEAVYGKGRWIYVGLGLWRELPAGVEGAYQLLANLISLD
jgi:hypothetical protein